MVQGLPEGFQSPYKTSTNELPDSWPGAPAQRTYNNVRDLIQETKMRYPDYRKDERFLAIPTLIGGCLLSIQGRCNYDFSFSLCLNELGLGSYHLSTPVTVVLKTCPLFGVCDQIVKRQETIASITFNESSGRVYWTCGTDTQPDCTLTVYTQ